MAIDGFVVQLATWSQLDFFPSTSFDLALVDILGHHFILCLDGNKDVFELSFGFGSEQIKRHRRMEPQFPSPVAVEAALLDAIDAATAVTPGIQVVEVLYEGGLCECDSQCVHGMVAMVIALCPVLNPPDNASVLVLVSLCESQPLVLVPVQFLHDIDKLPVIAQTVRDAADGRDDLWHHIFQNLPCLFGDVL